MITKLLDMLVAFFVLAPFFFDDEKYILQYSIHKGKFRQSREKIYRLENDQQHFEVCLFIYLLYIIYLLLAHLLSMLTAPSVL